MESVPIARYFYWKYFLVRVLVNASALALTALLTPMMYITQNTLTGWLFVSLFLGMLNAVIKPIIHFLTLPFLFVTYGLALALGNTLIFYLMAYLLPGMFAVESLFWALVGGIIFGVISSFFESMFGLSAPILPDEQTELRRRIKEQDRAILKRLLTIRRPSRELQVALAPVLGEAAEPVETPDQPDLTDPAALDGESSIGGTK